MSNCLVGSIRQVHRRLKADGYNVSEYALRLWVKTGELPSRRIGNKFLVSYNNAVAILNMAQSK